MKKLSIVLGFFILVFSIYPQVTYQLEIFGGYSFINPADLNLFSDYNSESTSFNFDSYYNYLQNIGTVSNLDTRAEGEFAKIKSAIPFGARFRVNLAESFAVALGVRYFSKTASSNPTFTYDMLYFAIPYTVSLEFTKFELMAKVLNPYISLFYVIPEIADLGGATLDFEIFAGTGYVMADMKGDISIKGRSETPAGWFEITNTSKEEGSGKGVNFFGGARINVNFASNIGMFIESNYDYTKIKKISSKGSYAYSFQSSGGLSLSSSKEWEGDLFIAEYTSSAAWGDKTFQYPTSNPDALNEKIRDFELNLSGFQILFGFFFRF